MKISRASSARSGRFSADTSVNIASFALGRNESGAVGIVNVDEVASAPDALEAAAEAIRQVPAIRAVWIVRLGG